jgi:hypothetical protein
MRGTITFELKPLLDLEMDFDFIPGSPARLTADPDFSYPADGPYYEFEEIRVYHNNQWHKVPDWLYQILNFRYEDKLIEAVRDWLDQA